MAKKKKKNLPSKITINNLKNPLYRQIHADGAIGTITPNGILNMVFYAQRNVIPRATEFKLEEGKLGDVIKNSEDSLTGIVRELEVGVYMDMNTCRALKDFLEKHLKQYDKFFSTNK